MRTSAVVEVPFASMARLDVQQLKVREVIEDYRAGRLVIPEFQREYVWKPSRAARLVDSLYRSFPVSVFLIWDSPSELRPRRRDPRPMRGGTCAWLIDGQQRVITLSRRVSGDEGIDVIFHPEEDRFRLASSATQQDSNWFHVSHLLDDKTYRLIRRALPEGPHGQAREAKFDRVRRILDYEIPVVRMIDHSFEEAVDAFTRINTLGTRLKMEDIESARLAAQHSGFIPDEVIPFVTKLRSEGFSRLNAMHLFRACGFVAVPDGRMRPLHRLGLKEITAAWARTKKATEEAIAIVRNEFGLVNMDILWSGALIVPVIALCASTSQQTRDPGAIAGWLALAALSHRYSHATESALDQDLRAFRFDDPIEKLLANLRRDAEGLRANPSDFNSGLHDRGAIFAVYIACRQMGLLDLFTGTRILLQSNVDRHHIMPRAQFLQKDRAGADTVANIGFINGETNRSVGAASPEVYLEKLSREVLTSQCIPQDRELWRIDRAETFWQERRALLARAFNDFLKSKLRGRRID